MRHDLNLYGNFVEVSGRRNLREGNVRQHTLHLLTGIMGAGKSTVAKMLGANSDFAIIDADKVAKSVIWVPENKQRLGDLFGMTIFCARDGLRTTFVMDEVEHLFFVDEIASRRRESFAKEFDPDIVKAVRAKIDVAVQGGAKHVIIENAVGLEKGWEQIFDVDHVITVVCSAEKQMERLLARTPSSTQGQHLARISTQWRAEKKMDQATILLITNGEENELEPYAKTIHDTIRTLQ